MATETTANAAKPNVRKSTTRKTGTRKSTAGKPAARKTGTKSPETVSPADFLARSGNTIKVSAGKAQVVVSIVAHAQLGVYGMIYDGISSRLASTRREVPRRWQALVKRGEKVHKDVEDSGKDLRTDIEKGVTSFKGSCKESMDKVKALGRKAAA